MDLADQLQKLQALREQGALTEEEFTLAKKRLIEAIGGESPRRDAPAAGSSLHQLKRSWRDKWIGGVCGGIAELSGVPSWAWRIFFVLTVLLNGLGIVLYLLLWIFLPLQTVTPAPAMHESS